MITAVLVALNRFAILAYLAFYAVAFTAVGFQQRWREAWIIAAATTVLVVLAVGALIARGLLRRAWTAVPPGTPVEGVAPPATPPGGWPEIPRLVSMGHLGGFDQPVTAIAFSPGRVLASLHGEGMLRLWHVADPARPVLASASTTTGCRNGRIVRFSPDGRLLAAAGNGAVLWDVKDPADPRPVATLAPQSTGRHKASHAVAFHPDGRLLVCGHGDGIWIWDLARGPQDPCASPWPWRNGKAPKRAQALTFTPDGRHLIVDGGNAIVVADTTDLAQAVQVGRSRAFAAIVADRSDSAVHALTAHPDGRFVIGAHELVDAGTGDTVSLSSSVVVGWDLDDPHHPIPILVLGSPWDIPGWFHHRRSGVRPLKFRGHDGAPHAASFAPDGTLLATADTDRSVLLWDTQRLPQLAAVARLDRPQAVTDFAFSPDGHLLATAETTSVTFWNTTPIPR